jgi:hypothetical protein
MLPIGFFQRAVLCREEQLLLRFFREGSRWLKLIPASLAILGAEQNAPLIFEVQVIR